MRPWIGFLATGLAGVGALIGLLNVFVFGTNEVTRHDVIDYSLPLRAWHAPVSQANVISARRAALHYWRGTRCNRAIPVLAQRLPAERIAQAHWHYDTDVPQVYFSCQITFNSSRRFTYVVFCAAMVHEYGHLAGFYEQGGYSKGAHSQNSRHVMYPILSQRNIPGVCRPVR